MPEEVERLRKERDHWKKEAESQRRVVGRLDKKIAELEKDFWDVQEFNERMIDDEKRIKSQLQDFAKALVDYEKEFNTDLFSTIYNMSRSGYIDALANSKLDVIVDLKHRYAETIKAAREIIEG